VRLAATFDQRLMDTEFKESLWCNVMLEDSKLLVGLCYRCPSSEVENNDKLLKLLELVMSRARGTHVMIMGDFNYADIDYVNDTVKGNEDSCAARFLHKTQELCLFQSVQQSTRIRQGQQPSTLDYIFTDEENVVEQLVYNAPLGNSGHVTLEWNITLKAMKSAVIK
jgi:endonuclease/exonuclease/phosphatase family metal-dependent hydrolase